MGFEKIEIFFNTESELHEPVISEIKNIVDENGLKSNIYTPIYITYGRNAFIF